MAEAYVDLAGHSILGASLLHPLMGS